MYPYQYKNSFRSLRFFLKKLSVLFHSVFGSFIPNLKFHTVIHSCLWRLKTWYNEKDFYLRGRLTTSFLFHLFEEKGVFLSLFWKTWKKVFFLVVVGTLFEKFHCFWHTVPIWDWVLNFWFGGITVILYMQFLSAKYHKVS